MEPLSDEVIHIRCRNCGEVINRKGWAYCQPCNLDLFYRAMPILLGMMMMPPVREPSKAHTYVPPNPLEKFPRRGFQYAHVKDIMD